MTDGHVSFHRDRECQVYRRHLSGCRHWVEIPDDLWVNEKLVVEQMSGVRVNTRQTVDENLKNTKVIIKFFKIVIDKKFETENNFPFICQFSIFLNTVS